MSTPTQDEHRRFLNAYYRRVKHIYDLTRKYFLFGRDRALRELLAEPWDSLIETGPGSGRNLAKLHAARPGALLAGVEASDEMLALANQRCPSARIEQGFAEDTDYNRLIGTKPDRILFSYSLSMVQDGEAALCNARRQLAPDGRVVLVDFGDLQPCRPIAGAFKRFLAAFHVKPPATDLLIRHEAEIRWGPGHYYVIATMPPVALKDCP